MLLCNAVAPLEIAVTKFKLTLGRIIIMLYIIAL